MTSPAPVELVGRSSSHFTRVARIFAIELGVAHQFRPVLDITSLDAGAYANNPALKLPVLVDEQGPLYGTENICRALVERAPASAPRVVLRGATRRRSVVNAEELTLHAMSSEVSLIMAKVAGDQHLAPPKVAPSLQNCLEQLDDTVDSVLAELPPDRALSFLEAALFCVVTHLEFREILDVTHLPHLRAFCSRFAQRESARVTPYRFDSA